jgi:homoserine O-acetyltransferase
MDYDPAPNLSRLKAPVVAINFADDALNPPELGTAERAVNALPQGRFVLVPASETSRGHATALLASHWASHLKDALSERM